MANQYLYNAGDVLALFKYPAYQLCTVGATIDSELGAEAHFARARIW